MSFILLFNPSLHSQNTGDSLKTDLLKGLSIEELMNIEITTVSKRPQKLSESASAIQVVTNEDIRRSAVTRLPEALRLAPNMQIAQGNSSGWAITNRGFNGAPSAGGSLANKLLIVMDGRSLYTPLFAGVYWDVQNVLLEDLDRIEVVSGPGGSLWGVNAVNGVINIQRKSAENTQGLYLTGAAGSQLLDHGGARYGGKAGDKLFYRVYGQRMDFNSTLDEDTMDATDGWYMNQGGFRVDYKISEKKLFTIQGDLYGGIENGPDSTAINGQNTVARWTHKFNDRSNYSVQVYFDRTWREQLESGFSEELNTYDFEFQHAFEIGGRNRLLWGAGYSFMSEKIDTGQSAFFDPINLDFYYMNGFIQDEISIVKERLRFIAGAKVSQNYFSGTGFQPSARMAWTPDKKNTVWTSVSRALRSASRFDVDFKTPALSGDKDFKWESLTAYEAGYRTIPYKNISASLSLFYNEYDDLRSLDAQISPAGLGIVFRNHQIATSRGFELSSNIKVVKRWRLRAGYTYFMKKIESVDDAVIDGSDQFEGIDPEHQVMVHSMLDLPGNFSLDLVARYISELPKSTLFGQEISPVVPAYYTFDARLAWVYKKIEIAILGQNLASEKHVEFGKSQIPNNIYGRLTCRF